MYKKRWNQLKYEGYSGINEDIAKAIIDECRVDSNKELIYFDRVEGGLCNISETKQIRFKHIYGSEKHELLLNQSFKLEPIIMNQIYCKDECKWTYEELDDIIRAFIKVSTFKIGCNCIDGFIRIQKEKMLRDYYFDSSNED